MRECRKFSAKFNMTKITDALQLGPLQLGGPGQWPVWLVVKTALRLYTTVIHHTR